jgi:hypothetical protein
MIKKKEFNDLTVNVMTPIIIIIFYGLNQINRKINTVNQCNIEYSFLAFVITKLRCNPT